VKFLRDVLNLVLVNFMAMSILGLFLIILAGVSLSFHTKTVLAAHKDRKLCTRLVVGTAILFMSVKRKRVLQGGLCSRVPFKILTVFSCSVQNFTLFPCYPFKIKLIAYSFVYTS